MNLKEAFRYQNKLQRLMEEAESILMRERNVVKVENTLLLHKVNPEATNETTVEAPDTEYADRVNEIAMLLMYLLEQRRLLGYAIRDAKKSLELDFDGEVSLNGKRQELANVFRRMGEIRSSETVLPGGGVGHGGVLGLGAHGLSAAQGAGHAVGAEEDGALVMSTGIIGHFLPMDTIEKGIQKITKKLKDDERSLIAAAKGIMTTDTHHKLFSKQVTLEDGTVVNIAGMAKGAGMIAPNMATFLGIVLTDAVLDGKSAQKLLKKIVHTTFNCITVDGHTSTNDSLLLLANGAAGGQSAAKSKDFANALESICADLARSIPEDGEGASHLVTINVKGLKTEADARHIARLVAESPLTKCALYGNDPNWGRIMSSAGYSGIPFDVKKATLHINGFLVFANGAPTDFDAAEVSRSMASEREITIDLKFGEGRQSCRFWTCDLTADYVHINADYHT